MITEIFVLLVMQNVREIRKRIEEKREIIALGIRRIDRKEQKQTDKWRKPIIEIPIHSGKKFNYNTMSIKIKITR